MSNQNPIVVPMTQDERKRALAKTQNAIKYNEFVSLDTTKSIDDEIARRKRKYDRLISLGVDPTLLSSDEPEKENPYLIEAMVLINEDKDVPPELLEKIKKYDQTEQ